MNKEFMTFLKEYGVIGLAIAVIMGGKLNALVTAVVEGLIMPIVGMVVPGGDWRAWTVGPFGVGGILGAARL
ncbi:MAG: MscL family protein [Gemmatimonadales bacterium]